MSKYKICIVIPCYKRPQRTRRIIEQVLNQSINGWEAFIIGDGCPDYQKLIDSGETAMWIEQAYRDGNKLHMFNLDRNYGGFGYKILNHAFQNNSSEYIVFGGNDDIILKEHFEYYLSDITNTDNDMVVYPTFIGPYNQFRFPNIQAGSIGHSEIIIKSSIINNYENNPTYGHDWDLIEYILSKTKKIYLSSQRSYTYIVTHIPGNTIDSID
jgi:glycosyltransferase involved in cell wall biosynthesis